MLITTHSFETLWCAYWYIGVNILEECVASIFRNSTTLNTDEANSSNSLVPIHQYTYCYYTKSVIFI